MSRNQFRLILVVSFILSVFSGVYDLLVSNEAVVSIGNYASELSSAGDMGPSSLLFVIMLVSTVAMLIAYIGLFLFWGPARFIYLALFILMIPVLLSQGVNLSSGEQHVLVSLSNLLSGFIIATVFVAPPSDWFR